jgi:hypothetical protein
VRLKPAVAAYIALILLFAAYLWQVDRLWPPDASMAGVVERTELQGIERLRPTPEVRVHFEGIRPLQRAGRNLLALSGWGLVAGESNADKQLLIALRREDAADRPVSAWPATIDLTPRQGVARAHGVTADPFLGFATMIDPRELAPGTYRLGLVLIDDDGPRLGWTAQHLTRTPEATIAEFVSAALEPSEAAAAPRPAGEALQFHVERVDVAGDILTVSGWAFVGSRDSDALRHYVVLAQEEQDIVFHAATLTRWGVHELHADGGGFLAESGFLARIPLAGIEPGTYSVDVVGADPQARTRGRSQYDLEVDSTGQAQVHRKW